MKISIFRVKKGQCFKSVAVSWLIIIAAGAFLFIFNPASSAFYAPCPFHTLTGFHCPGCGSLRALHQLLHGNLATAFGLNPLTVLVLPFLGYSYLSYVMSGIRGRPLPNVFVPAILIWIFMGILLLFWFLRNISIYPFSLLAP